MDYRRLGRTGVKVSPICLGAGVRGPLNEERFYMKRINQAYAIATGKEKPPQ